MRINVLDHGYVELVERWGSDERIIEAARMSTNKGFKGWGDDSSCAYSAPEPLSGDITRAALQARYCKRGVLHCGVDHVVGDEKLLRYLYEHRHMSPFEMAGMVIEVQAPLFVFREWHRHRTQSYNELSARYTPMPDLNYLPSVERLKMTSGTNKQAQAMATVFQPEDLQQEIADAYTDAQQRYEWLLENGAPKELARLVIPVGRYSRMRASANLRNWLQFLTLRLDPGAQWEIQQYAQAVGELIAEAHPRTWALFSGQAVESPG